MIHEVEETPLPTPSIDAVWCMLIRHKLGHNFVMASRKLWDPAAENHWSGTGRMSKLLQLIWVIFVNSSLHRGGMHL